MNAPVRARLVEGDTRLDVVIDAPPGNVLTAGVMAALGRVLAVHESTAGLRCVTLRAAGKNFSFGASVEEHRPALAREMLAAFHGLIRRVGRYPVPVLAAVQGRCLGGAFELTLACHLVVCAAGAAFACPEVRLGVFPPALAALGPSRLGGALTERLIVTGAELTASQGMSAGFVTETAPEGAEFEAWTSAWVTKNLAPLSAFALRQAVKAARRASGFDRALDVALDQAEAQYLAEVVTSHDGNEGIEAFLAKRPPAWRDA